MRLGKMDRPYPNAGFHEDTSMGAYDIRKWRAQKELIKAMDQVITQQKMATLTNMVHDSFGIDHDDMRKLNCRDEYLMLSHIKAIHINEVNKAAATHIQTAVRGWLVRKTLVPLIHKRRWAARKLAVWLRAKLGRMRFRRLVKNAKNIAATIL